MVAISLCGVHEGPGQAYSSMFSEYASSFERFRSQTCPEAEMSVFSGTQGISLVILSNVSFNTWALSASAEFFEK